MILELVKPVANYIRRQSELEARRRARQDGVRVHEREQEELANNFHCSQWVLVVYPLQSRY